MEIAFSSKKLRQLCEVAAAAELALGPQAARELRGRLSDIDAADTAEDLPLGNPRLSLDDSRTALILDLLPGVTLVFVAMGTAGKPPKKLREIRRLILQEIEVTDESSAS